MTYFTETCRETDVTTKSCWNQMGTLLYDVHHHDITIVHFNVPLITVTELLTLYCLKRPLRSASLNTLVVPESTLKTKENKDYQAELLISIRPGNTVSACKSHLLQSGSLTSCSCFNAACILSCCLSSSAP